MKFAGIELKGAYSTFLVIPKGLVDVVFTVTAVYDRRPFEELCPKPKPPNVRLPNQKEASPDFTNADYLKAINDWQDKRHVWLCLKSLEDTEELVWDRVDINNPDTYDQWEEELIEAGFTYTERVMLQNKILEVCGLSVDHIEKATDDFLASRQAQQNK